MYNPDGRGRTALCRPAAAAQSGAGAAYSLLPSFVLPNDRARTSLRHKPISLLPKCLLQCTEGLVSDRHLLGAERQRHRGHSAGLGSWSGQGVGWRAGGGKKASENGVGPGFSLLKAAPSSAGWVAINQYASSG